MIELKSNITLIVCLAIHVSLVFVTVKVSAQLECDLHYACEYQNAGELVTDPDDCHNYYICITSPDGYVIPSSLPIQCENGTYFNGDRCVKEQYSCSNPCVNYGCKHACDAIEIGYVASPYNCSEYYVCLPDSPPAITYCSEWPNFYFNGTGCTWDPKSCCNICTPHCEKEYTEVYDPYDCHSYYLCFTGNYTPSTESHFTCSLGQKFDELTSECVDDRKGCTPICNDGQ